MHGGVATGVIYAHILAIQYCTAISTDSKGVHTHAAAM